MVTVFIWDFRGSDVAWGHASLLVDQTYMSWWPEGQNRERSKISDQIYSVHPIRDRRFSDDTAAEGGPPKHRVEIRGLNEARMKDWWQSFGLMRDGVLYQGPMLPWETLAQNCSTVAARGLSVGGGDRYARWIKSWQVVWTPNDVLNYALSIRTGLAPSKTR
jgi:hypothetical protein